MKPFGVRRLADAELDALLKREEDFHFDCKDKRKKPADLLDHVVGFANAHGGRLIVGLRDRKEAEGRARINGFVSMEQANDYVAALTGKIEPPIRKLRISYLDTGAASAHLLMEVRVPRSSRRHRVGGKVYLRENAATNPLDERRAEFLWWEKLALRGVRSLPYLGLGVAALLGAVFGYGWLSEPSFDARWTAFPTGPGLRDEYELRLETGSSRGDGIVDVHGTLDFAVPIARAEVVNSAGCEQLEVVQHVVRAVIPGGSDEKPSNTVEFRAARCAPESTPVVRLTADSSSVFTYDSPLLPDDGHLQVAYSWRVPVLGYRAPMRPRVEHALAAPSTQWHNYYIPTRGYPASISNPPYYDLQSKRGRVASFIRTEDYETLPAEGTSLAWIGTPAARIRLSYEHGFFKGWIRWLPCDKPLEVEAPPSFSLVGDEAPYRAIVLTWEGCTAKLDFAGASMDTSGNVLVQRP